MSSRKSAPFLLIILLLSVFNCDYQKIASEIDNAFIEISGLVTENGEAVSGALVLLVASASISDGFGLSNGSITTDNGNYIIIDVDAGEYYIVAVEDSNGNLQFDIESDRLGFYGVNLDEFDIVPDIVTVSDEDIEDINITYLTSM
ncbi:MAG TPA: carboxypeptidase regulatory-like domain-containing protein [Candidatus Marinimicrobia bacterium]|nr:carboxypeptidase regulatory-like domain-containing protein [Candidatus Neomarinimicrobiota bacterium]